MTESCASIMWKKTTMNTIYKDNKDMYHPPYKYSLAYQEFAHSLSFTYSILAELHPRQSLYTCSYVFCYAQKCFIYCAGTSVGICAVTIFYLVWVASILILASIFPILIFRFNTFDFRQPLVPISIFDFPFSVFPILGFDVWFLMIWPRRGAQIT